MGSKLRVLARSGRRLLAVGAALGCVGLAAPSHAGAPPPQTESSARRPPLIVVRGVGPVPDADLYAACRTVIDALEPFPVRCEKGSTLSAVVFTPDWNPERNQLDGRAALEHMFRDRAETAHAELVITNIDLYEDGKPYVFGLASLTDRVAIVSTARIGNDHDRLRKLVAHEVGHTLGLSHHQAEDCVMRTDTTVSSLDDAPFRPCRRCRQTMIEQADVMSRPGQIALDHARGYLVRGELWHAQRRVEQAIEREPVDVTILNQIAESFLATGQVETALRILQTTLERAPQFAHAHINLALALRARGRLGDLVLALEHFDEAVRLEPAWGPHADRYRRDIAHAQGPRQPGRSRP